MSFHKCYCFIALCDGCGEACWETEPAPHFANEREAREALAAQYEWRITRQINGRFEMLCRRCADKQDCARYGCKWTAPELDHGSEQQARWDAEHPEPLQMCGRCGALRRDHTPTAADDSAAMTRELSDEQEEILAELDQITWPEDADTSPAAALNDNPTTTYRGEDQ